MVKSDIGARLVTNASNCYALLSVLTELLKQAQLQSMSVSVSPFSEACSMIAAFLCTETTHLQTLRVVDDKSMDLLPNEEDKMIGHNKKIKIDTCLPLPESNGTFKL